jgi:hypothetical protein
MNKEGGRFSDGLLLGILLGGAIVFLLGTEKGKKVLRLLTAEGGSALEGILKELDEGSKKMPSSPVKHKTEEPKIVDAEELSFSEHPKHNGHKDSTKETKNAHRFFRRSKPL